MSGASVGIVVLALGGGVGCAARAAVRELLVARGISAAMAILGVNLLGAALAGAAVGAAANSGSPARIAAIAVLSGWTTYSAFSTDFLGACRDRRYARAAVLWIGTILAAPPLAGLAARIASEAIR
jgi:fluoride ion exporter CrcB/FEX